jgi:hypothetical protein
MVSIYSNGRAYIMLYQWMAQGMMAVAAKRELPGFSSHLEGFEWISRYGLGLRLARFDCSVNPKACLSSSRASVGVWLG